jgi:hypothetical protein
MNEHEYFYEIDEFIGLIHEGKIELEINSLKN